MLKTWARNLARNTHPQICHYVIAQGEPSGSLDWLTRDNPQIRVIYTPDKPTFDLGTLHNVGAAMCLTPWMMKLDVDVMVHPFFFDAVLERIRICESTGRIWFNVGFICLTRKASQHIQAKAAVEWLDVIEAVTNRSVQQNPHRWIEATQFVCKTGAYLSEGGCLDTFHGYAWEDYMQLYMLAYMQGQADPLAGLPITKENVTQQCREVLSKKEAQATYRLDNRLVLLHLWHSCMTKTKEGIDRNRDILYDYITKKRNS